MELNKNINVFSIDKNEKETKKKKRKRRNKFKFNFKVKRKCLGCETKIYVHKNNGKESFCEKCNKIKKFENENSILLNNKTFLYNLNNSIFNLNNKIDNNNSIFTNTNYLNKIKNNFPNLKINSFNKNEAHEILSNKNSFLNEITVNEDSLLGNDKTLFDLNLNNKIIENKTNEFDTNNPIFNLNNNNNNFFNINNDPTKTVTNNINQIINNVSNKNIIETNEKSFPETIIFDEIEKSSENNSTDDTIIIVDEIEKSSENNSTDDTIIVDEIENKNANISDDIYDNSFIDDDLNFDFDSKNIDDNLNKIYEDDFQTILELEVINKNNENCETIKNKEINCEIIQNKITNNEINKNPIMQNNEINNEINKNPIMQNNEINKFPIQNNSHNINFIDSVNLFNFTNDQIINNLIDFEILKNTEKNKELIPKNPIETKIINDIKKTNNSKIFDSINSFDNMFIKILSDENKNLILQTQLKIYQLKYSELIKNYEALKLKFEESKFLSISNFFEHLNKINNLNTKSYKKNKVIEISKMYDHEFKLINNLYENFIKIPKINNNNFKNDVLTVNKSLDEIKISLNQYFKFYKSNNLKSLPSKNNIIQIRNEINFFIQKIFNLTRHPLGYTINFLKMILIYEIVKKYKKPDSQINNDDSPKNFNEIADLIVNNNFNITNPKFKYFYKLSFDNKDSFEIFSISKIGKNQKLKNIFPIAIWKAKEEKKIFNQKNLEFITNINYDKSKLLLGCDLSALSKITKGKSVTPFCELTRKQFNNKLKNNDKTMIEVDPEIINKKLKIKIKNKNILIDFIHMRPRMVSQLINLSVSKNDKNSIKKKICDLFGNDFKFKSTKPNSNGKTSNYLESNEENKCSMIKDKNINDYLSKLNDMHKLIFFDKIDELGDKHNKISNQLINYYELSNLHVQLFSKIEEQDENQIKVILDQISEIEQIEKISNFSDYRIYLQYFLKNVITYKPQSTSNQTVEHLNGIILDYIKHFTNQKNCFLKQVLLFSTRKFLYNLFNENEIKILMEKFYKKIEDQNKKK
jgi:hypothetical protein